MSTSPDYAMPWKPYPRDVTSPDPVLRRVVIPSQRIGKPRPTEKPRPQTPEKGNETADDQQKQ